MVTYGTRLAQPEPAWQGSGRAWTEAHPVPAGKRGGTAPGHKGATAMTSAERAFQFGSRIHRRAPASRESGLLCDEGGRLLFVQESTGGAGLLFKSFLPLNNCREARHCCGALTLYVCL